MENRPPRPATSSFLARLGEWKSASHRSAPSVPRRTKVKRLILPVTRKGGVGKTAFLAALADWLEMRKTEYVAFDTDWCNGTLTRFLPQARFLEVEAGNAGEVFREAFEEVDTLLLDGLGPLQGYMFEWLRETEFFQGMVDRVELTYVVLIEEDKDTVFQAGEAAAALGHTGHWLVVRNLKVCPTTEIYNTSPARKELEQLGAVEIQMDRIPWNILLAVQSSGSTIGRLAEDPALPFLDRQRMRSYLNKFHDQLQLAQHVLLPSGLAPVKEPDTAKMEKSQARPRIAPERV